MSDLPRGILGYLADLLAGALPTDGQSGVLIALFSSGGAAFLWVAVKGIELFRNGTQASEGRAIKRLEKYRVDADARADRMAVQVDFWRARAGVLEYVLFTRLGADAVPALPPKPWERREIEVTDDE